MKRSKGVVKSMELKECPVFSPTEEEFKDPIKFISQIRSVAEPFGMCRIVPPKCWNPPFAQDKKSFRFSTKVQELHHLQERPAGSDPGTFKLEYLRFRDEQNLPVKSWPRFDGDDLDLCQLFNVVRRRGGYESVTKERKWSDVLRSMFPGRKEESTQTSASQLQGVYRTHLLAYERFVSEEFQSRLEKKKYKKKSQEPRKHHSSDGNQAPDASVRHSGGSRQEGKKVNLDTLLSGLTENQSRTDQLCQQCKGGGHEDLMLLCDRCNTGWHMYCLSPPLENIPEGNWYCQACVSKQETFGFATGDDFTMTGFQRYDTEFRKRWFGPNHAETSSEEVEEEFWRIVEGPSEPVEVLYGSDIDTGVSGSGFPRKQDKCPPHEDAKRWADYASSPWNLNVLATSDNSMLRFVSDNIPGVIIPWLYMGMTFSSFCWHFEDHCFYSINYVHWGFPKIWYGVPGYASEDFEKVMKGAFPDLFSTQPDLLFQLVTMLNPMVLKRAGIPVYRTVQAPGEFVITFPRSYHAGLNQGLNCAEAVNFAPKEWLTWSRMGVQRYRLFRRKSIISHEELLCVALLNKSRGSSAFDAETSKWIKKEGEGVLREERALRENVWADGTVRSQRLQQHNTATAITDEEDSECIICRYYLYLSSVTCSCRPNEPVCLEHSKNLCDCPGSKRTLQYRWSLAEIEDLLEDSKATEATAEAGPQEHAPAAPETGIQALLKAPESGAPSRRRFLSNPRFTKGAKGPHSDRAASWVSRMKVLLRSPPTLEAAWSILQEAEEFLWAGHEVDQAREVAANMRAAITWAEDVARCLGVPFEKPGNAAPDLASTPQGVPDEAGQVPPSDSKDRLGGGQFQSRRVNLSLLERLLDVKEVPCVESNFKHLKALHRQASEMQKRMQAALTADPPVEMKVLHTMQLEINRSIHIELPETVQLRNVLAAAQSWVDAVRRLIPTTKAVRRRAVGELPDVQVLLDLAEQGKTVRVKVGEHTLVQSTIERVNTWRKTVSANLKSMPTLQKLEALVSEADAIPVRLPELSSLQERLTRAKDWADQVASLRTRAHNRQAGSRLSQKRVGEPGSGPAHSAEAAEAAFLEDLLKEGRELQVAVPDLLWLEKEVQHRRWKLAVSEAMEQKTSTAKLAVLLDEGRSVGQNLEGITWLEEVLEKAASWETRAEATLASRGDIAAFCALASEAKQIKAALQHSSALAKALHSAQKLQVQVQGVLKKHQAWEHGGPGVLTETALERRVGQGEQKMRLQDLKDLVHKLEGCPVSLPGAARCVAMVEKACAWHEAAASAAASQDRAGAKELTDGAGQAVELGQAAQAAELSQAHGGIEQLLKEGEAYQDMCVEAKGLMASLREVQWEGRVRQLLEPADATRKPALNEAEAALREAQEVVGVRLDHPLLLRLGSSVAAAQEWLARAGPVANGTTRHRIHESDFRLLIGETEAFSVSVGEVKNKLESILASHVEWFRELRGLMRTALQPCPPVTTAKRLQELQVQASRSCISSPEKRQLISGAAALMRWLETVEAAVCLPAPEQSQHQTGQEAAAAALASRPAKEPAKEDVGGDGLSGQGVGNTAEPGSLEHMQESSSRIAQTLRVVLDSMATSWRLVSHLRGAAKPEPAAGEAEGAGASGPVKPEPAAGDAEVAGEWGPGVPGSVCFCGKVVEPRRPQDSALSSAHGAQGHCDGGRAQRGDSERDVLECASCTDRFHLPCLKKHGLHKTAKASGGHASPGWECMWCSALRRGDLTLTHETYSRLWRSRRCLLEDLRSLTSQTKGIPFRVVEMDLLERVVERATQLQHRLKDLLQPVLCLPAGEQPRSTKDLAALIRAVSVAEVTVDASWAAQCQARRGQGLRLLQASIVAHRWHTDAIRVVRMEASVAPGTLNFMLTRGQAVVGSGDSLLQELRRLHAAALEWQQQRKHAHAEALVPGSAAEASLRALVQASGQLPAEFGSEPESVREKLNSSQSSGGTLTPRQARTLAPATPADRERPAGEEGCPTSAGTRPRRASNAVKAEQDSGAEVVAQGQEAVTETGVLPGRPSTPVPPRRKRGPPGAKKQVSALMEETSGQAERTSLPAGVQDKGVGAADGLALWELKPHLAAGGQVGAAGVHHVPGEPVGSQGSGTDVGATDAVLPRKRARSERVPPAGDVGLGQGKELSGCFSGCSPQDGRRHLPELVKSPEVNEGPRRLRSRDSGTVPGGEAMEEATVVTQCLADGTEDLSELACHWGMRRKRRTTSGNCKSEEGPAILDQSHELPMSRFRAGSSSAPPADRACIEALRTRAKQGADRCPGSWQQGGLLLPQKEEAVPSTRALPQGSKRRSTWAPGEQPRRATRLSGEMLEEASHDSHGGRAATHLEGICSDRAVVERAPPEAPRAVLGPVETPGAILALSRNGAPALSAREHQVQGTTVSPLAFKKKRPRSDVVPGARRSTALNAGDMKRSDGGAERDSNANESWADLPAEQALTEELASSVSEGALGPKWRWVDSILGDQTDIVQSQETAESAAWTELPPVVRGSSSGICGSTPVPQTGLTERSPRKACLEGATVSGTSRPRRQRSSQNPKFSEFHVTCTSS